PIEPGLVPRLMTATAIGSFAFLALLFFIRDPRRRELGLYALFAGGVAFFLFPGLVAGRASVALAFILPATGYLFLVRFLALSLTRLRIAMLAIPTSGTLLALVSPESRALGGLSGAALFALGGELLVAL